MSLLFTPQPHLFSKNPTKLHNHPTFLLNSTFAPKFPKTSLKPLFPVLRSSLSSTESDPDPQPKTPKITDEWGEKTEPGSDTVTYSKFSDSDPPKEDDEWGEKTELGSDAVTYSKFSDSDPSKEDDEWGGGGGDGYVNSSATGGAASARVEELKRCLVDSVYGTELGFRAGQEVRAEVVELVNQLEALNPTPAPVENTELLDGTWVLVYTAFSELLPLLAAGATPLLKVEKISQSIDTSNLTIVNSTTLSGPFASFSFSASAAFEIRSSSRIQVEFKEGTFQPPEVKPTIDLPESVDLFGQRISLMPVQQSLSPLQEAVAGISRAISGQPPLKLPIPGERTKSWLLITYLDKDMRISRGDGGLFVLVKEGSPLLN